MGTYVYLNICCKGEECNPALKTSDICDLLGIYCYARAKNSTREMQIEAATQVLEDQKRLPRTGRDLTQLGGISAGAKRSEMQVYWLGLLKSPKHKKKKKKASSGLLLINQD